ncbi:MAG: DUF4097 family beta strand repeat-containing protein [Puia sp.]|nr:DUF4097 family beta strand repeat-containing protein [Puia sp.]
MKKIRITAYWILLLFTGVNLHAQTSSQPPSPEELTVPLSQPGKPYSLNIALVNGSIKVTSYPGKDIIIEASSRNGNKKEMPEDAGNGMKRISPKNGFEITAKEENNNITIENKQPSKLVDLSLKIPQDVTLKLSTINNGEIDVDNIRGELEINNVNGSIKLTNISGSAVASTVNGTLTAVFNAIDPKSPMAFSTLNGNVDLTLPATAKASLKLRSDRGEILTDFDVSMEKAQKTDKTEQTHPGMYQMKLDDWILCKIGGGGPEILMKNMNGNIYIRKTK